MREALVSIAAGASQLPLIEAARRLGLAVIAIDRDPQAPGMLRADARVVASSHDPEAVLAGLRRVEGLRPCAVATQSSGMPVATCAHVAAALGLPGLNPAWADEATSKPGQLALCERAGVPVPFHAHVGSARELAELGLAPPVVCKPARTSVGKRGIRIVRAAHQLEAAFEAARRASPDGAVEVERYLPGRDVVLAALFAGSRLRPVVLFDEHTACGADGGVQGRGFQLPSTLSGAPIESALVGHARRLVERLELGSGVLFATFRVAPKGRAAHVLELHFDLAGDHLAEALFPAACDFPLLEAAIDLLRGRELSTRAVTTRSTVLCFVHGRDLAMSAAQRIDLLRALPETLRVELRPRAADDADDARLGFCLARGGAPTIERIDRILGRSRRSDLAREA